MWKFSKATNQSKLNSFPNYECNSCINETMTFSSSSQIKTQNQSFGSLLELFQLFFQCTTGPVSLSSVTVVCVCFFSACCNKKINKRTDRIFIGGFCFSSSVYIKRLLVSAKELIKEAWSICDTKKKWFQWPNGFLLIWKRFLSEQPTRNCLCGHFHVKWVQKKFRT